MSKRKATPPEPDESWDPPRVAAFMQLPYQKARNQMLEGRFGPSDYDPVKRKLTVKSSHVRAEKARRDTPTKRPKS